MKPMTSFVSRLIPDSRTWARTAMRNKAIFGLKKAMEKTFEKTSRFTFQIGFSFLTTVCPHQPTVVDEKNNANPLQSNKDLWCFLEKNNQAEDGNTGIEPKADSMAYSTHDTTSATSDDGVTYDHQETRSW